MKKLALAFVIIFLSVSCNPSAEKVKEQCLKDKDNQVFYGEQTPSYCDCIYEKLKEIQDSQKLTDEIVDSVKAECDAEYTNFDTNF